MARKVSGIHGAAAGEEGLLLAVIAAAVHDYQGSDPRAFASAAEYLAGPMYREHLSWLDLPPDWKPEAFELMEVIDV